MEMRMVEPPPSWSLWRAAVPRMVGHWPENDWGEEDEYISRRLRQEETEQQDWSPLGKTKAGTKSALPPIIFSGLIRWEADLGPCGFCGTTKYSRITRTEYFNKLLQQSCEPFQNQLLSCTERGQPALIYIGQWPYLNIQKFTYYQVV